MSRWMAIALIFASGCASCRSSKQTHEASIVMDAAIEAATIDAAPDRVAVKVDDRPHLHGGGQGDCLIAGYFAYEDLEKAKALADRIRTASLFATGVTDDSVDVYDTRDFDDLTWNQLVVVAGRDEDNRPALEAALKKLKPKVPRARVHSCVAGIAFAVRDAADVLAGTPVADEPIENDFSKDQNPECFGWSVREHAAACIAGSWNDSEGHYDVVFPGSSRAPIAIADWKGSPAPLCGKMPPCLMPTAAARVQLEAALKAGGYLEINTRRRELGVGKFATFARPALTFRMPKANRVDVECANGVTKNLIDEPLAPEVLADADDHELLAVHVRVVPDPSRLLLSYEYETKEGPKIEVERDVLFDPSVGCVPED